MIVILGIFIMLTIYWIIEFVINIIFWIGEEEDRIFPWQGIPIVGCLILITLLLFIYV